VYHNVKRLFTPKCRSLWVCDCPGYTLGGHVCKHIREVWRTECPEGYRVVFSKNRDRAASGGRRVFEAVGASGARLFATFVRRTGEPVFKTITEIMGEAR
jgi:hypothetical protein